MTKPELLEGLAKCEAYSLDDAEAAHSRADDLLIKFIDDNDILMAFERIHKWYA